MGKQGKEIGIYSKMRLDSSLKRSWLIPLEVGYKCLRESADPLKHWSNATILPGRRLTYKLITYISFVLKQRMGWHFNCLDCFLRAFVYFFYANFGTYEESLWLGWFLHLSVGSISTTVDGFVEFKPPLCWQKTKQVPLKFPGKHTQHMSSDS